MTTNWTDRLSEYLDGDMPAEERSLIEQQLETDTGLRQCLDELRMVRDAAGRQPEPAAPGHLWDAIEARIQRRSRQHKLMFTLPQFAAAAAILLLLGVGLARLAVVSGAANSGERETTASEQTGPAGVEPSFASSPGEGPDSYSLFVEDLEQRLEAGRGVLDAETVRVLEQSLEKIDMAIDQARFALEQDPNSTYLNRHLASARARKLRLLEDATALVAART